MNRSLAAASPLLALLFAVSVLALPACGGAPRMPPSAPSALGGAPLPDFQRRTLDGVSLDTAGLRGRVVVVKFFARYCEPCEKTLPAAEAMARGHAGVAVVGIAEDELESEVRRVVSDHGLTFPVVHDRGNVLSGRYRVSEMPATFVADAQGVIRWVGGPEQSEDDLAKAVAAAGGL